MAEVSVLGESRGSDYDLPLLALSFGNKDPKAPVLGIFGGVHGLERIGAQVALSLLQSFSEALLWDEILLETLKKIRVLFFPIINPLGILHKTRSNPRGVDLMRNAPVEAIEKPNWLLGGHRLSARLPWYRGQEGLELENQALFNFCQTQFFQSSAVITVDFHSGFGLQDQIWFPYAKTKSPFPHVAEMFALSQSFEKMNPHHFYKIEPQSLNYTTHGDVWDHIYEEFMKVNSNTYLPLAVEMGSWLWMKKNPLQIFSSLGPFNPMTPHRQKRVLRRHMSFFDFLIRATASPQHWSQLKSVTKLKYQGQALDRWYSR